MQLPVDALDLAAAWREDVLAGDEGVSRCLDERIVERTVNANKPLAGPVALPDLANVEVRHGAAIRPGFFRAGAVRTARWRIGIVGLRRPCGRRWPAVFAVFGVRVVPPLRRRRHWIRGRVHPVGEGTRPL